MSARAGLLATLVMVAWTVPAHAVASIHMTLSARQAEVGDGVRVELDALSTGESPGNPRLRVPPGFTIQGPNVSSSQQISFMNGTFEHRRGITATWIVVGTRPGHFVIGPATVDVGTGALSGESAQLEIVPPGSLPRQQQNSPLGPSNPFDPFSMLQRIPNFPNLDDLDDAPLLNGPPEAPAEYGVEHAADSLAFLRATVSPSSAVVGEQVTLRVYAYGNRGPYDEVGSTEPSRADFLSQSIVDSSYRQPRYLENIDGSRWSAVKIREVALFPLRGGTLAIGPMRMGFRGPGYPESAPLSGLVRESKELRVVVNEPPLAGRPPGYELGDVGNYSLSAAVEPRRVEAGDATSVTIRIEGTGNVPEHVKLPEQHGIEWLEPSTSQAISPADSTIAGWRAFRYVVRLDEPGTKNLGEVTLPYYDAVARKYAIARAVLGSVDVVPTKSVAPAASASAAPAAPRDPLEGLQPIVPELGRSGKTHEHLTDCPAYWALLALGPSGVIALGGLTELAKRLRRRFAARAASRATLARRALGDARNAAARSDAPAVASAVERALYAIIEERLGVKARAVLRHRLSAELESSGADSALAREIVAVLDACDALRFGEGSAPRAADIVDRAASAVGKVARTRTPLREQAA